MKKMEQKIKEYLQSIGLADRDVQYYISHNYTLEEVKESIEQANKKIEDLDLSL